MTETAQNGKIGLTWFAPRAEGPQPQPAPADDESLDEARLMLVVLDVLQEHLDREQRRLDRTIRWCDRGQFWSRLLMGISVLGLINLGLSTLLKGTEVGRLFEIMYLLGLLPIAAVAVVIGICRLMAGDLPDVIEDQMQALRRAEARFRRPGR
jgi:hypothetical protein